MARIILATAAVFCALLSLLALHELRVEYRKRNAYEATSCTIVSRSIVEEAPTTESSDGGPEVTHYPVRVSVSFAYRVGGRDFTGAEARFFEKGEPGIKAHYDAHAPESTRACWYDPKTPGQRAVLDRQVSSRASAVMLLVGVVGAAGFALALRMQGALPREPA